MLFNSVTCLKQVEACIHKNHKQTGSQASNQKEYIKEKHGGPPQTVSDHQTDLKYVFYQFLGGAVLYASRKSSRAQKPSF